MHTFIMLIISHSLRRQFDAETGVWTVPKGGWYLSCVTFLAHDGGEYNVTMSSVNRRGENPEENYAFLGGKVARW